MSDNLGEEFDLHLYELRQVPPYVVCEYFWPTC